MEKAEETQAFFEASLERTGDEYFDFYMPHGLNAVSNEKAERLGAWQFCHDLKEKSLVKHFGFSFHGSADAFETILIRHPEVDFVQIQINYLDWDDEKV